MNNRRNFFKDLLRYLTFGVVTSTGVKLMTRKPALENQVCINRSICKKCKALPKCELPKALSMKNNQKRQQNGKG